jgi:D-alanyl-lipoteichoic acid acyltransferase DltB (MBOAT superfamily)
VYDPQEHLYFSSSFFLCLFFALLIIYRLFAKSKNIKIYTIIFFSLFFFYKNSGYFFILLFLTTLLNFYFGNWLYKTKSQQLRKFLFLFTIIVNLGLLGYFKYTNFFIQILNDLHSGNLQPLNILMPVGISFYTFKAMSYVIELYIGSLEPTYSLKEFCLYMFFFPNILMGPIDRAANFLPQVQVENIITKEDIGRAVFLIICGLFKKNVIADYIGINFVDRIFQMPLKYTGVENLLASYSYTIQLYCDFSGYTDIAIGIGLLLGYKMMDNFNIPFSATSIAEYWRRWHISLSSWLLDYMFKPLQMSFRRLRIYGSAIAIFLTFLAIGIWHGANWTFVVFGLIHSVFMVTSLLTMKYRRSFYDKIGLSGTKILILFQMLITFHLVVIGNIVFRSDSLQTAYTMFSQILTFFHGAVFFQWIVGYQKVFVLVLVGFIIHFIPKSVDNKIQGLLAKSPLVVQALLLAIMIIIVVQVQSAQLQPFIYFNF